MHLIHLIHLINLKHLIHLIKTNSEYFLDVMKTSRALVGLILDKDIIFVSFKLNYNGSISQSSRVKDNKHIFKEIKLYYLRCPSLVNYEKQNASAQTYTNINAWTLIHTCTHTYTNTHTHTRMHIKTHACTLACARVHPHTQSVLSW